MFVEDKVSVKGAIRVFKSLLSVFFFYSVLYLVYKYGYLSFLKYKSIHNLFNIGSYYR